MDRIEIKSAKLKSSAMRKKGKGSKERVLNGDKCHQIFNELIIDILQNS